jgi:fermentation-respiration switch protein FrsA (DUF1100 family)
MRLALSAIVGSALLAMIAGAGAYRLAAPSHMPVGAAPADLPAQSAEFSGAEGAVLRGWYIPSNTVNGAVILMHGVHANRFQMLDRARFLHRAGYSVLLYDSRAHGESTGDAITFGYLESQDAAVAVSQIRKLAPNQPVAIIGVSLGGAACSLADPPLEVNALILESVYPSIQPAIANRLRNAVGPAGTPMAPLLAAMIRPRLGFPADRLRPIDHLAHLRTPKLIAFGTHDRDTLPAESKQLFDAAAEPKEMWSIEGAGHVDLHAFTPAEYESRILAFLHKVSATESKRPLAEIQ